MVCPVRKPGSSSSSEGVFGGVAFGGDFSPAGAVRAAAGLEVGLDAGLEGAVGGSFFPTRRFRNSNIGGPHARRHFCSPTNSPIRTIKELVSRCQFVSGRI